MTKLLEIVEVDLNYCGLTYGVAPCQAYLGVAATDGYGARFDGTNDYLTRGAGLTGAADSKKLTFSLWMRADAVDSARLICSATTVGGSTTGSRVILSSTGNRFSVFLVNSAQVNILNYLHPDAPVAGRWYHFMGSVDLNDPTKRHVYLNDVRDDTGWLTYTNDTADFTYADWSVGSRPDGVQKLTGAIADLWFQPGLYLDLSDHHNRRLFIDKNGRPVSLGPTGELPTGSAPLVFLSGAADSWHTNLGTGGGFTLHGALADPTGSKKCFNTLKTCQDRADFDDVGVTFSYVNKNQATYLPKSVEAMPSILSVDVTPGKVSLGEDLGERQSVTVTFEDRRHSDVGPGYDKYVTERPYDPWTNGTLFGRFYARFPFVRGRELRWRVGEVGDALEDMETRYYLLESLSGPTRDGKFTLTAKDPLKLADDERARAPLISTGFLTSNITAAQDLVQMSPTGILQAEYPAYGVPFYANLGGEEIAVAVVTNGGNDANTILLLKGEGSGGEITTVDSSASARTVTRAGNSIIQSSQKKFGTASMLFDTNSASNFNVPDSAAFAFGTGSWTIDFWVKVNDLSAERSLFNHGSGTTTFHRISVTAAGAIKYLWQVSGVAQVTLTGPGGMVTGTWYHIAMVRNGNTWTLYRDGVVRATTTSSLSLTDFTGVFACGAHGGILACASNIDEFRVSNVARWTSAFTPPAAQYSLSADYLDLTTRGAYNTTAVEHTASDRVQVCLEYVGQTPDYIVNDLFVNFAGVDPTYIPASAWDTEISTYYNRVLSALITEPTSVRDLVSEIIEQIGGAMWWDAVQRLIQLKIIRSEVATQRFDRLNVMQGSLNARTQEEKRYSQVWVYYGLRNPLLDLDQETSYLSVNATVDLQSESDYGGGAAIKKIVSRWIAQFGSTAADRLGQTIINRRRDPPRLFTFDVMRGNVLPPSPGGAYVISAPFVQDDEGYEVDTPVQVISVRPTQTVYQIEAEEILSGQDLAESGRAIIINVNTYNVNVRTAQDALYGAPSSGDVVNVYVNEGVIVGSTSTTSPSMDFGSWPAGVTINLYNKGRVQGKGGRGSNGDEMSMSAAAKATVNGGTAIYTRYPINVFNNVDGVTGEIWGGGGGGAGGRYFEGDLAGAGGGGGGAGSTPGAKGTHGFAGGGDGAAGTTETYGAGGTGTSAGGHGGLPGQAGQQNPDGNLHDQSDPPLSSYPHKGLAGNAIDGSSYVTISGTGSILGPQVN